MGNFSHPVDKGLLWQVTRTFSSAGLADKAADKSGLKNLDFY
jgi:hypothetical protein